jgi:hypothetical protein
MLGGMSKFLFRTAPGVFLLCSGFAVLAAQNGAEAGIPPLLEGIFHAIEYTQTGRQASGATLNGDFSCENMGGDNYRLTFTNYHFYILNEAAGAPERISATISGTLTMRDFFLNGNLSVKGLPFSSFAFNDLAMDELREVGGVTADGVFYSQEEVTAIIDNAPFVFDTMYVINWERECIIAAILTFFSVEPLEWNRTTLLEAMGRQERPPEGYTAGNDSGTLTALVRGGGVEYTYRGFAVVADFLLPVRFKATGRLRVGVEKDVETLSFDGKMTFDGLECFSSAQISGCVLQEKDFETGDIPGTVVIDNKSYRAAEFFVRALQWFDMPVKQ